MCVPASSAEPPPLHGSLEAGQADIPELVVGEPAEIAGRRPRRHGGDEPPQQEAQPEPFGAAAAARVLGAHRPLLELARRATHYGARQDTGSIASGAALDKRNPAGLV